MRAGLPVTTIRSPGFKVWLVMPTSASSERLSISSRHCCLLPLSCLTSIVTNGCGLTNRNSVTICLVPASGGEWTQITEGKHTDHKPRWAPNGKTIYFLSDRTGYFNVWGIRFDSGDGKPLGEPFRVTAFESPARMVYIGMGVNDISLSRNRLVLPITEVTGNLWMLENVDQ